MVAHHHDGVVAEGIGLHQLSDALVVGAHAAANERHLARRNVVAALQSALACDAEDGLLVEVLVAEADDFRLWSALRGVHLADDVSARRGDALVACEIEVDERSQAIDSLVARVQVGFVERHGGLPQNAADEVGAAHFREHVLAVALRGVGVFLVDVADVVGQHFRGQRAQFLNVGFLQDFAHGVHFDAVGFEHPDVLAVLRGCLVHVEIVLEQGCRGVNHAVEEFLPGRVHQDVACRQPFGLRIGHLWGLLVHSCWVSDCFSTCVCGISTIRCISGANIHFFRENAKYYPYFLLIKRKSRPPLRGRLFSCI